MVKKLFVTANEVGDEIQEKNSLKKSSRLLRGILG